MPELPEVETIRRDLAGLILDKKMTGLKIIDPKVIEGATSAQFRKLAPGATVNAVVRRAKFLIWELSSSDSLIFHLRLNGQLVFSKRPRKDGRVIFEFKTGVVNFIDRRRLARVKLSGNWRHDPSIKKLGPEPFSKEFNPDYLKEILKNRKANIKPILMDQTVVAGIGNIYSQEALFLSGIRPTRPAGKVKSAEVKELYDNIKKVLKKAIQRRGSSVDSYVDAEGREGEAHLDLYVYQRQGEDCLVCGSKLKSGQIGGRGTTWCPKCQI